MQTNLVTFTVQFTTRTRSLTLGRVRREHVHLYTSFWAKIIKNFHKLTESDS